MDTAFAALLKKHRLAAGLTQEALADRAGLGVRSIQGLERGENHPVQDTLRRLVDALALGEGERAQFLAAGTPPPRRSLSGRVAPAPPSRPAAPRHNLPRALTALIGREVDQRQVLALLSQAPLLTLIGTGGVGKTRLALAVAVGLLDQYPDGVWLVELASLAEARLVPQIVLETLGTREEVGRPLLATLTDHLKGQHLLLVLDNCEHLVTACAALVEAVLRRCPGVQILATSREGLEVAGEHRYRVPSLPIPDLDHLPPPERLADAAAVALFLARARERRSDFALTAQNARVVAQICARLDGIPLAIELAAARVESLGLEGIAARLDDRFHLLTGGPRMGLPRQRTLRAALDWSYDLLAEPERLLLDRLSVFAGGWSLEAAESVCGGDGLERWEILDLLAQLVNKSLVQSEDVGGELRYGLLETVRQYGQERLAAAGSVECLRDRHLAWYLALAEAAPHFLGSEQVRYCEQLEKEHDNVRAALRWARERGATEEGLRLAGVLGNFWVNHGYLGEGRAWLEDALTAGAGGSTVVRARALFGAADLAFWQGDFAAAAARSEQSLSAYRDLDDTRGIASGLHGLGRAVYGQGDSERARALHEESLALARQMGDPAAIGLFLSELGRLAVARGEYGHAVSCYEESLAFVRESGFGLGIAYSLCNLACVLERCGAYERATALQQEALARWREVGSPMGITASLMNLGWALLAQGEDERGMALLEESLARSHEEGHFWGVPSALTYLGWAAYRRGAYERAATLQEQALARYRQIDYRSGIAWVLAALGCALQARGAHGQAAACLRESLQISHTMGARDVLVEALEGTAWVTVTEGQAARATRLGGAAEALREALGAALHPALRGGHDRAVQAMRSALDEAAFTAAWAEGRALPLDETAALALEGH